MSEPLLVIVNPPLIWEMVAEDDRKLLEVTSPVKEIVPLMVAKVADGVRRAVEETTPKTSRLPFSVTLPLSTEMVAEVDLKLRMVVLPLMVPVAETANWVVELV